MKKYILLLFFTISNILLYSQLSPIPEQYIIFQKADSGYDLYIKKMNNVESILLTESQKDPFGKKTTYTLQTEHLNPANSYEVRVLNNEQLKHTSVEAYYLADSTPEHHTELGDAFYFFLPDKVIYGGVWAERSGSINIKPGLKINLRLFEKKYADYDGKFIDQWITLKIKHNKSNYHNNLLTNFTEIATLSSGYSIIKNREDSNEYIFEERLLENLKKSDRADFIFIIDTTASMKEEIPVFKKSFKKMINNINREIENIRVGFIFFRDYGDKYLTKIVDFESDVDEIVSKIVDIEAAGGSDIPEAIYEAICEIKNFNFEANDRYAFLIGDAPAHSKPRGSISRDDAIDTIKENNIIMTTVALPYK